MSIRTEAQIDEVASAIRPWGAVVVVGAGLSASAYPMTSGLHALVWHALDSDPEAKRSLINTTSRQGTAKEIVGHDAALIDLGYQLIRSHPTARKAFQQGFVALDASKSPSAAHVALARLLHAGLIELVISFNWDSALERAYLARYGVEIPSGLLVKPHGDAREPEQAWVLPDEEGRIDELLAGRVQEMLDERPRVLTIVGYSESDERVVSELTEPIGSRWPVARIGPSASGELSIASTADYACRVLVDALVPSDDRMPDWRWVRFGHQHGAGAALLGYRLGPKDVDACVRLPEADQLLTRLRAADHAVLVGESGSGKSVAAFQTARSLSLEGWEVVELCQAGIASMETVEQLAQARRPTLAVVDDAQALAGSVVAALDRAAHAKLKVLRVETETQSHSPVESAVVRTDPQRAVSHIREHISANKTELWPTLQDLDDRLGDGPFSISLERRMSEADAATKPWQFMFILTGGDRRARDVVAELRRSNRTDLLLALLSTEQLLSRDAGVLKHQLLDGAAQLGRDEEWVDVGLDLLNRSRVMLQGEHLRTTHLQFAHVVLRTIVADAEDPARVDLIRYLRSSLLDKQLPLSSASWLIEVFQHQDAAHYPRAESLVSEEVGEFLTARCVQAPPGSYRASAAWLLARLLRWDRARKFVAVESAVVARWAVEATEEDVSAIAWLAGQLRGWSLDKWQESASLVPALAFAQAMRDRISLRGAHGWANLLQELREMAGNPWAELVVTELDHGALTSLGATASWDNGFDGVMELAEVLIGTDYQLALEIASNLRTAFAQGAEEDIAGTISAMMSFLLLTFVTPGQAEDSDELAYADAVRKCAHQLISEVDWQAVAERLTLGPYRNWHSVDVLAKWMRLHLPEAYDVFAQAFVLGTLDAQTAGLWSDLGQLRPMVVTLSLNGDRQPAREWITSHSDEIVSMPACAAVVAPEVAVAVFTRGGSVSFDLGDGLWWEHGTSLLRAIREVDPKAAEGIFRSNLKETTSALQLRQGNMLDGVKDFLEEAEAVSPSLVLQALSGVDLETVEKCWPERLAGLEGQGSGLMAVLERAGRCPGKLGALAGRLMSMRPA